MGLSSVLSVAFALSWGTLAATRLEGARPLTERLGLGLAGGLALLLWLPFLLGVPLGLWGGAVASLLVSAGLLGFEIKRNRRGQRTIVAQVREALTPENRFRSLAYAATCVLAIRFLAVLAWSHSLWTRFDPKAPAGASEGLWTAGYGFGDQAMHATFASSFLHGPGFVPPRYPIFAGWFMTYPFIPDFAVASLTSLGLSLGGAFTITLAVALAALFLLVVALARRWTGRGRAVGLIAAALFFMSGGFGAWEIVAKLLTQIDFDAALMSGDLTQNAENGLVLNNITNGILLPARNAAFGMALGAAALVLLVGYVDEGRRARRGAYVAGVLVGLLPMVHTHSFLLLGMVAVCWAGFVVLKSPGQATATALEWSDIFLPIALVAGPQVLWVKYGLSGATSFVHPQIGWESGAFDEPTRNAAMLWSQERAWLWFWLKNAGLFGVLCVPAFFLASRREKGLVAPFMAVFVFCNLARIQPWSHDSVKLFAWVWLGFTPLVAGLLARLWRTNLSGKALAIQGLVLCVATGFFVLWRESRLEVQLIDASAVRFAKDVGEKTPRDAVILTASSHNHPVPMLAGRTIALGYKGWLWPHGVSYQEREVQVQQVYGGKGNAKDLVSQLHVGWIVVGPDERREFDDLDERAIARLCEPPFVDGAYKLYRVRQP